MTNPEDRTKAGRDTRVATTVATPHAPRAAVSGRQAIVSTENGAQSPARRLHPRPAMVRVMRQMRIGLVCAAALAACQTGDEGDQASPDAPDCVGKCDGLGGPQGSLPVVVRAATWDGRAVLGLSGEGQCTAMAVRPGRIDRSQGSVQFAPAVFSQGQPCPTDLGHTAIAATPGFDQNPYPSNAAGDLTLGGDHLTYQLSIISAQDPTPDDEVADVQLVSRRAMLVLAGAYTEDAEVADLQWLTEAEPLTAGGQILLGSEPTVTADAGLLVWRGHPDNVLDDGASPLEALVYARRSGDGWTAPRSLTELFTEADVDVDGMRLADRYPLAARQLRGPDGATLAPGSLYRGAYPWISQDGTELFHTTTLAGNPDRPGEEGRRGGVSVIGQATGHALRHLDGPINPSRDAMTEAVTIRELTLGLGRSGSPWQPYRREGSVLPLHDRAPTYPVFSSVTEGSEPFATYTEVGFDEFADQDYLVYLPMNENIGTGGDFTYDLSRTPDISGRFHTASLSSGARFAVEELGEDANTGARGRAIYFSSGGRLEIPASFTLLSPGRGMTVSMFVQRLSADDVALLEWPGVASMTMSADGTVTASVTSEGEQRQLSAASNTDLEQWAHVAFTYDSIRGISRIWIDGAVVGEQTFGRGFPGAASGDLLIGPGAAGGGDADGPAVVALDEVAISRVQRTQEELVWAATGTAPAGPPMGGAELMSWVPVPTGVDPDEVIVPVWAPVREEAVALGELLFFDPRLSANGEVSCATCHDPQFAWTDGRAVGLAIDGTDLGRATPTIFNRALSTAQFWDGRSRSVEAQALSPIGSPREMNLPLNEAVARLQSSEEYVALFQDVFGRGPDISGMANAIAAFERAQLSGDSPVDRFEAGDLDALTSAEQRGRALFHGKARCVSCHSGSNYTDEDFHDVGIVASNDMGRYFASGGREKFIRSFKTPTLRNIDVTGPYFHNGSVETLEDVVALYNEGPTGEDHDWESRPLGLTDQEQADLVAFLRALTSPNAVQEFDVELPEMPGF